jgi:Rho GDP-dissociation inhibitor
MTILCKDRPGGDIHYDLTTKDQLENLKKTPFVLKEGCEYKIRLQFKVQHELVTGLKHVNLVYRKGVRGKFYLNRMLFPCNVRVLSDKGGDHDW